MIEISKNALSMPTSGIRAMTVLASRYDNVVSFGLGEPDFPTPENIIEAGCDALRNGWTKYVSNQGIPLLLSALAEKMRTCNGMAHVTEDNIHITFGAGLHASRIISDMFTWLVEPRSSYLRKKKTDSV